MHVSFGVKVASDANLAEGTVVMAELRRQSQEPEGLTS
jgi:hypothetical protein